MNRSEDRLSADRYHAERALSKSGVGLLVDECPAKYWWQSPFNPDREEDDSKNFDIGRAAHLVFLEPELFIGRTVIIKAEDYKKKDAQQARDDAYLAGLTPLLEKQAEQIAAMHKVLMKHPLAKTAFRDGIAERSHFWTDKEFGIPCKARPDWQSLSRGYVVDYKTTASANPIDFAKSIWEHHYFVQHPWYLDGIHATTGERPTFMFVAQEKKAPYLVSVFQLDLPTIEWGKKYAAKAKQIFARCLERDEWPGYRDAAHPDTDRAITLELPAYAQYQLAERDERDEFFTGTKDRRYATKSARIVHQFNRIGNEA